MDDSFDRKAWAQNLAQQMLRPHAPFPYLVVHLFPTIYGICPLTPTLTREQAITLALREAECDAWERSMCLVLSDTVALYIAKDGVLTEGPRPFGGRPVEWKLRCLNGSPSEAVH